MINRIGWYRWIEPWVVSGVVLDILGELEESVDLVNCWEDGMGEDWLLEVKDELGVILYVECVDCMEEGNDVE